MSYRVVQRGKAPLVICYLVGPHLDSELRDALPGAAIVATSEAPLSPTRSDVDSARALGEASHDAPLVLVGYSAGVQSVRALLLQGMRPAVVATIDGTHAAKPPAPWQVELYRALASEARSGKCVWVATCCLQRYTNTLPSGAFTATSTLLAQVLDVPELATLPASRAALASYPGPTVLERHEGGLHLLAYGSTDCDAAAHRAQQSAVLPAVLRRYVAPVVGNTVPPSQPPTVRTVPPPEPRSVGGHAIAKPLSWGAAVLAAAKADLTAGIREVGHNAGEAIERLYLDPLGVPPGSSYCAAAVSSWIRRAARELGKVAPVKGSAGAKALGEQFRAAGLWTAAGPLLRDALRPGDVLLWDRSEPMGSGWQGHVGVICDVGQGVAWTIEANADRPAPCDAVAMVERRLDDPRLLGAGRWPVT